MVKCDNLKVVCLGGECKNKIGKYQAGGKKKPSEVAARTCEVTVRHVKWHCGLCGVSEACVVAFCLWNDSKSL